MKLNKTLSFLNQLKSNNNKEWMDSHRSDYMVVKEEFLEFIESLIKGIASFDESIRGVEPKKSIFRINRDIRFSADKSPYKLNMGAAMAEGGRNSGNPLYYFHIQPDGQSMVAGGLYQPPADHLKKIRQEIDYNPVELKKVVENLDFKSRFGALAGETLKSAPKGYPKDHPNIELLRHKSFIAVRNLTDKEVLSDDLMTVVLKDFETMKPLNDFLAVAIS